jgi:hypothetical protein
MFGLAKQTVRPRSARWTPVPLCLVVFCLTAIVVYCWGKEIWIPTGAKAKHTATAYVVERAAKAGQNDARIPIAAIDDDPRRAEAAANAQADDYVKDRRAEWQRRTQRACYNARQAVEQARRDHAQNEDRLAAFRLQMAGASAKPPAGGRQPANASSPAMIDNPRWLDLNHQLDRLQQRRTSLLIDRTPAHPAVEDVAVQIKGLQRKIASVPRQIPAPAKQQTPATPLLKNAPTADDSIANQDTEKLNELKAAVETTRLAYLQAGTAEKQARDAQQASPHYTVVYAQIAALSPPPGDHGWVRLMYTTLAAGMLMAFGAGLLSAGANIQPPVASVAEVQAAAGAPIMATIPATGPLPNPFWLSRRQKRVRRTLLAAGLLLMLACPAAAAWGLLGI